MAKDQRPMDGSVAQLWVKMRKALNEQDEPTYPPKSRHFIGHRFVTRRAKRVRDARTRTIEKLAVVRRVACKIETMNGRGDQSSSRPMWPTTWNHGGLGRGLRSMRMPSFSMTRMEAVLS